MTGFETAAAVTAVVASVASSALAASQANQQAQQQIQANQAAFAARSRQAQRAQEIAERRRKEQLKRETARRRAAFGASGTGSAGGSSGAVVSGLTKSSALAGREDADQRQLSLSSSLVDLENSNRSALLRARHARQKSALDAGIAFGSSAASSQGLGGVVRDLFKTTDAGSGGKAKT